VGASTGLLNAKAAGLLDVSDATAISAIVNTTGDLKITDLSAAKSVNLTSSGGSITTTATKLAAATKVVATAAKTAKIFAAAATDVTVSATGTKAKPTTINNETANTIKTVTLSGNGGALYADLTAAGTALVTLNAAGSQNITTVLDASGLTNLKSVNKTGTGTLGLIVGTAAGDVDLSSQKLDSLSLNIDNFAQTLTVADGQNGQGFERSRRCRNVHNQGNFVSSFCYPDPG